MERNRMRRSGVCWTGSSRPMKKQEAMRRLPAPRSFPWMEVFSQNNALNANQGELTMAKLKRIGGRRVALAFVGLIAVFGFTALMIMANPPGSAFDLDGNTAVDHSKCDWDQLNGTTGQNGNTNTPCQAVFVKSFAPGDNKQFTGGHSKDAIDISPSGWQWKAG